MAAPRSPLRAAVLAALALLALVLSPAPAQAQTYAYDAAGRLTRVTYADGTTTVYTYDSRGNRTSKTTTAQPPGGGGGGGGCFIATAAYGSPLHPHVQALRDFRSRHLITNAPGRALNALYLRHSPPIAAFIAERPLLRTATRWALASAILAVAFPRSAAAAALLAAALLWTVRRRRKSLRLAGTLAAPGQLPVKTRAIL